MTAGTGVLHARLGAYGLRLTGTLPDPADLLDEVPGEWPDWRTDVAVTAARPAGDWSDEVGPDTALLALGPGTARLDRVAARTELRLPSSPSAAELAHPYLSATGALAAWWRGDLPLHGGAFVVDGRAWALLGDREAGKSTAMASVWAAGVPVLADDLVVVRRGGTALAGPRTLDLRRPAAEHLGVGEALGVVGARERWRIRLGPVPAEVPFAGFVVLGWGPEIAMSAVPLAERPGLVFGAFGVLERPADPVALLDAFSLPMWRLRRPRDLARLDETTAALLSRLA